MTELQWLTCTEPDWMLACVSSKAGARKPRLFACACCRRIWEHLREPTLRDLVEVAEAFADGRATLDDLKAARQAAGIASGPAPARSEAVYAIHAYRTPATIAVLGAAAVRTQMLVQTAWIVAGSAARVALAADEWCGETELQCALLRDIFGNPFCPVAFDPRWLTWDAGAVTLLAQAIYDERRFADLPVLADALEEAGCTNESILAHCRGPGPHVCGCWVLDLLLGKG